MALSVIQSVSAETSASATSITTTSITTSSGNLIHAGRTLFTAATATDAATPISDNKTNSWTAAALVSQDEGGGNIDRCGTAYAKNITGGAGHTFKYTASASADLSIAVTEIAGADTTAPLDVAQTTGVTLAESNTHTAPAVTNVTANAIYMATIQMATSGLTATAVSPDVVETQTTASTGEPILQLSEIVSTVASRQLQFTVSPNTATQTLYAVAVYKIASSGVTVSLTGVSSTAALGTLAPARALPITGVTSSAALGTFAPANAPPLTGVTSSAALGTLAPALALALTGVSSTAQLGTITTGAVVATTPVRFGFPGMQKQPFDPGGNDL